MKILGNTIFLAFGLVLCAGCGDSSSQSWESGKPQASAGKSASKSADATDNNAPAENSGEAASPHGATNPHGANPHGGMMMPGAAASAPMENDGKLDVDTIHWSLPKSWVRKQPNTMLKAEYAIPHEGSDKQDIRITVSQVGGSIESNVTRWKKQFQDKDLKESQEAFDAGGAKVVLVDLAGTFDDPGNMMSAPVTRSDYRMVGAAIELPGEQMPFFIKCYGPAKTMKAHADEIKTFIRSMKIDK